MKSHAEVATACLFMGFEDFSLTGLRLFCPTTFQLFSHSAKFPGGPNLMHLQFPRSAMERIGVLKQQRINLRTGQPLEEPYDVPIEDGDRLYYERIRPHELDESLAKLDQSRASGDRRHTGDRRQSGEQRGTLRQSTATSTTAGSGATTSRPLRRSPRLAPSDQRDGSDSDRDSKRSSRSRDDDHLKPHASSSSSSASDVSDSDSDDDDSGKDSDATTVTRTGSVMQQLTSSRRSPQAGERGVRQQASRRSCDLGPMTSRPPSSTTAIPLSSHRPYNVRIVPPPDLSRLIIQPGTTRGTAQPSQQATSSQQQSAAQPSRQATSSRHSSVVRSHDQPEVFKEPIETLNRKRDMAPLSRKPRLVASGAKNQALVRSGSPRPSDETDSSYSFEGYKTTRHRSASDKRTDRNHAPSRERGESTWVPRVGHLRDESGIPEPGPGSIYDSTQFSYLNDTDHYDDEQHSTFRTMRVVTEGDNVVIYRRRVLANGGLSRQEDGPYWALDIAWMTLHTTQKNKKQRKRTTRPDSDTEGHRKHDNSDSDGDGGGDCKSSKSTSTKPSVMTSQRSRASGADGLKSRTTDYSSQGRAHSVDGNGASHYSLIKSGYQYGLTPSGPRGCGTQTLSSGGGGASGDWWPLEQHYCKAHSYSTSDRGRIRGHDRECRGAEKCFSEHDSRHDSHSYGVAKARHLPVFPLDTGCHSIEMTSLSNGAGAYSEPDRTQPAKWPMSLNKDGQYRHLVELEESLGMLSLRGDSIACFALSILGTHLSPLIPNLPSITQDPTTRRQAMASPEAPQWRAAEAKELESLVVKKVYIECVLPPGRKLVRTKWVYRTKKENGVIVKYKARLVAMGYTQLAGIDFTETYSPVARFTSIRIILAVAVKKGLEVHQMDVETAFLNADLIEEIYVATPPGYESPGRVWKLLKALYGLKQSPRVWNASIDEYLRRLGFVSLEADVCIYVWRSTSGEIYLALYVDDLLLAVSSGLVTWIKAKLNKRYKMTDLGRVDKLLGLNIKQSSDNTVITVGQGEYIREMLKKLGLEGLNSCVTPVEPNITLTSADCLTETFMRGVDYRQAVGCLLWIANGTRPDISYAVSQVSRFLENPGPKHWQAVKRIIRYLVGTADMKIRYSKSVQDSQVTQGYFSGKLPGTVAAYVDADYATCKETRRSVTGYIFLLAGGPVSWNSRKQPSVALSTTEAEYMAAASAVQELVWLKRLQEQLGLLVPKTMVLYEDNQSTIFLSEGQGEHQRSKHIDVKYRYVQERVQAGEVKLEYIRSQNNLADILTKALVASVFSFLVAQLLSR